MGYYYLLLIYTRMKTIKYLFLLCTLILLAGCDDQFSDDLVRDNRPAVPVTYPGATTNGFNPYYTVSIAQGGNIEIRLSVPEGSGRTIKEISKVVGGGTAINAGNVADARRASYIAAPIAGSGTTATFTTNIAEFNAIMRSVASTRSDTIPSIVAANTTGASVIQTVPPSLPFIERAFMFSVVLDDNSVIIPVQCRIRVTR